MFMNLHMMTQISFDHKLRPKLNLKIDFFSFFRQRVLIHSGVDFSREIIQGNSA
jgi:hypothetical protein